MKVKLNLSIIYLPAFCLLSLNVCGQKLPKIQQGSVRAPNDIKIDGTATEWNDQFKAYNPATDIYYTLSNDDDMLYLAVKADRHEIADKILRGGITLTINHSVQKKDPEAVSITYPVLRDDDMSAVANMFARKSFDQGDGVVTTTKNLNQVMEAKSKVINIEGIKTITGHSISVYPPPGIPAVGLFDTQNNYTYELAIALKYLDLPDNGASAFSYHIKVNDLPEQHMNPGSRPSPPVIITQLGTTDFWGEYTLAKR